MSLNTGLRPKFSTTCFFWAQGCCNKSAEECNFQHVWTDTIAPVPGQRGHTQQEYTQVTIAPPMEETEEITCYYWHHNGWCNLSDGDCQFVHWHTGRVASAPGSGPPQLSTGQPRQTSQVVAPASSVVPGHINEEQFSIEGRVPAFDPQRQQAGEGMF